MALAFSNRTPQPFTFEVSDRISTDPVWSEFVQFKTELLSNELFSIGIGGPRDSTNASRVRDSHSYHLVTKSRIVSSKKECGSEFRIAVASF